MKFKIEKPRIPRFVKFALLTGVICGSILCYIKNKKKVTLRVKYLVDDPEFEMEKIGTGDWIDVRSALPYTLKKGDRVDIPLGFAMKLPMGYEAHLIPRSSTCRKLNIWMENSMGLIDNSFCGDNDEWKFRAYAIEDTEIPYGARIAQFRIVKTQPDLHFKPVKSLSRKSRGGFGSTGQM